MGSGYLQVAASADPTKVCGLLGDATSALVPQTAADVAGQSLQVSCLPTLQAHGKIVGQVASAGLGLVLTCRGPFVVDYDSPLVWAQMLCISSLLGVGKGVDLAVFSMQGRRLFEIADFLPCCIAIAEEPEFQQTPLSLWPTVREITVDVDDLDQVCVTAQPHVAPELWLAYLFHLMQPLGWCTKVTEFPPRDGSVTTFCSAAEPGCVRFPPVELKALHRLWYMVARLHAVAVDKAEEGATAVEVQVVSGRLWQGCLPDVFEVASLEDWWRQGSQMCDLSHSCRVFSGPFPLPEGLCVFGLDPAVRHCIVRKQDGGQVTDHTP